MKNKELNEIISYLYTYLNGAYNTLYTSNVRFKFKGTILKQIDLIRDEICEIYQLEQKLEDLEDEKK